METQTSSPTKLIRPTDPDEIADALAAPFKPSVIAWRAGKMGNDGHSALAMSYIDARDVTKRLDQVLGIDGWKSRHYAIGSTQIACEISVRIKGEWISKTDGASIGNVHAEGKVDSKREAEIDMEAKGAFSAALKRAAVAFGIGRYLYDLESPWADCEVNQDKRWKKWSPKGLKSLEAIAAVPYNEWKKKRDAKKKAAEAAKTDALPAAKPPPAQVAPAPQPAIPPPSAPAPTSAATPVQPAQEGAPGPAPALTGTPASEPAPTVATPASHPAGDSGTGNTPVTFPRPDGDVEMRQALYFDALKFAADVREVGAITATGSKDPDFAEGTVRRTVFKVAVTEAMQRFEPAWTWEKAAAKKLASKEKTAAPVQH